MNKMTPTKSKIVPFSLKDAPSFIETQFPVNRVSAEAYKERKAIHGQVLTSLGSYWKGRKPLILVRASILGVLLPATDRPLEDLRIFLLLMGMDDTSFKKRIRKVKPADVDPAWSRYAEVINANGSPAWRRDVTRDERFSILSEWLLTLPYGKRLAYCLRPEECSEDLYQGIWPKVNAHLGTAANSIDELVDQLGRMRFGHRPRVADTFAGGGSIPFEAARIGCDAWASDLNPIAGMLTWGGIKVIGAGANVRGVITATQTEVAEAIKDEIAKIGVEKDAEGRQAKAYLYCVEVRCPKTGYLVPLAPSWVISKNLRTVAKLIPRPDRKDYEIRIIVGATDEEIAAAEVGTFVDDRVVHPANPNRDGVAISVIRGDRKNEDGVNVNLLRKWNVDDFEPRESDIFRERLYCIQWFRQFDDVEPEEDADDEDGSEEDAGPSTFFASPTAHDLANEKRVRDLVRKNLKAWQKAGLVPDEEITPGQKTDELIRTRGWTYWHHLFLPRHLLFASIAMKKITKIENQDTKGALLINFCRSLNYMSRLTQWMVRTPTPKKPADVVNHVFYNQAFNTFYNFGCRSSVGLLPSIRKAAPAVSVAGTSTIVALPASEINKDHDVYVTDPPYADAINYHEITEYFIAWARSVGKKVFPDFTWESRRHLAIKGVDEKFRSEMVAAYKAMAAHMPDHGVQIVMFTHQDAGVWADLAAIMWAAGLRVTAAWNVVTETESSTKKGNYVQGTILLVLRKRLEKRNGRRMNIEGEIEDEVKAQLDRLNALGEDWTAERLYTDGDLQLAAYAAALRVITNYETIDRKDVGADVFRKLAKGEKTVIRDLIEYAASVANNMLVPDGFPRNLWRECDPHSRFYVRMLDMESKGSMRFADYQNFSKTFAVENYTDLMDSKQANKASLAGAACLKGSLLGDTGFGVTPLRRVLFAVFKTMQKDDPKDGLAFLRTELGPDYWGMRLKLVEFARYISIKTFRTRPKESEAADLLAQKLEVDRV
ncbi:anti-phage-associated DUF1156 domain-containing protein [Methylocystis sp. JAN1]|uniref:anti-phage-associated DUF1156 domain-containing protein n=1 Tax=Methylocystis sp. JAN1 TaxID=3397211 RepID=UPI003FA2E84F